MPNDKKACPHCGVTIPAEAMRKNRPFSCPDCRQIVATIGPYNRIGPVGWFSFLALCTVVAALVGHRGSRGTLILNIVVGIIVGIVGGFVTMIGVSWVLRKLFPRTPKLGKYEVRDNPKSAVHTADFLDSVRDPPEWSGEKDRELDSLWRQHFQDDDLEEEALMAAEELKARLTNSSEKIKHVSDEIRRLSLNELRKELAAIAADLRLATK